MNATSPTINNPPRTVLVDTSLLIELQKRAKRAAPVRRALAAYGCKGASSYSKLEFKRAWLQRLGFLHRVCCDPETDNLQDVIDKLNRLLLGHPGHKRRVTTCLEALNAFLDVRPGTLSSRAALARFRSHCKAAVLGGAEALRQIVTTEFKGTGCIRAEELPSEKPGGSLDVAVRDCRPKDIQCTVHKFFASNKATFQAIAKYVDDADDRSDELAAMRDHIRKAQEDPTHLCDNRHCAKLGDAIIAIDGKEMDEFAANNDTEWVPIAGILKKPLINPVKDTRYVD